MISKKKAFKIFMGFIFVLIVLFFMFPFILMVKKSLDVRGFENYRAIFSISTLASNFKSSVITSVSTVFLVHLVTLPAAYAISKYRFHGRMLLFYYVLAAMMIPPAVMLVPLLVLVKNMGLLDHFSAVILPFVALFSPFILLIQKNAIDTLPNELLEAARIDGAGRFYTFLKIIIPLSKPTILVTIMYTFMSSWNEFLYPLVFLRRQDMQTVTVVPQRFIGTFVGNVPQMFAAGNVILLPMIILYLFLQQYFESGFVGGAIKG